MTTIKKLIENIEQRLFLQEGLDVQIHAEGQIAAMLQSQYNELFDTLWDMNYLKTMTSDLNGTTGEVIADLSAVLLRYQDIYRVFYDEDERPLPMMSPESALSRVRTRCIMPSFNPTSVFKLVPADETGPLHIWFRTKIPDSVWDNNQYDTDVPYDADLLLYGVVTEFLTMDDSNQRAAVFYAKKFELRKKQIEGQQWQFGLNKRKLERDGPATRWSDA